MSEWISVRDRLPEQHIIVALMNVGMYANNGDTPVNNEHVVQAGYLSEFGEKYWSVYGERGHILSAYTHWAELPPPQNKPLDT